MFIIDATWLRRRCSENRCNVGALVDIFVDSTGNSVNRDFAA